MIFGVISFGEILWILLVLGALVATGITRFALFLQALVERRMIVLMPVVGAGNQSLVTLLVSPVAIVIGAVVLDETLAPRAYGGFALLALGLLVIDGRILARFKRV